VDLEDVALLTSDQGRYLLARLPEYDPALAIKLSDGLRQRGVDPKLAAAALTQSRLRAKARAKFGEFADQLLFTDHGLQQATRLEVAARHAQRYLGCGAPEGTHVADLTGGVGADALAMAALGLRVTVYERDPVTAAVARANLAAFPEARVVAADSLEQDLSKADALFADPSRRTDAGRRVFDPAAYDPPLDRLIELADTHPLGVKVAPGIAHRAVPPAAEAQWVSVNGDVVEAALWFGRLRSPAARQHADGPFRTVLVLRRGRAHHLTQGLPWRGTNPAADAVRPPNVPVPASPADPRPSARQKDGPASPAADAVRPLQVHHPDSAGAPVERLATGPLQEFIYEPDGAVIRASLIAEAAASLGSATLVSDRIAYVTADAADPQNPFLTGYRVQDAFPFNLKRLRGYLREHGIGQVVVKKRGTAVDPAELRKRLTLKGDEAAVVILTRLGARQSVVIAQPLTARKDSP
jgi:hypothetical protein